MKSFHIRTLVLVGFIATISPSFGSTPLLDFDFNGSSSSTTSNAGSANATLTYHDNTGSITNMYSAAGTGVSGAAGDTALNNTSAGAMGSVGNNPAGASTLTSTANIGTVQSFTITGWYNASTLPENNAQLLSLAGNNTISLIFPSGQNGMRLGVNYNGANATSNNSTQQAGYAATGSWVFFAVTYDGTATTNNLNFYIGNKANGSLTLAGTRTAVGMTGALNIGTAAIGVGNAAYASGTANRPVNGLMDDVSFYDSSTDATGALSLSQLDQIRMNAVPEPRSAALLIGGAGALAGFAFSRRPSRRRST